MAANKKAVLIYADWIHTVEKLSEEEAGRIFKHLLRYVNDQDPEPPDRLTEITFEPWKQTMKRDLKKWEGERERFSKAGQASAASRAKKKTDIVVTTSTAEPTITIPSLKPGETVQVSKKKAAPVVQDEKRKPGEKINLIPFDESFRPNWDRWIDYKRVEHKTQYKRLDTEQAQFKHLVNLAENNPVTAAKIIDRAIVGTWKGFYKLKDEGTEKNSGHSNASGNTGRFDKFSTEYERQFGSEDSSNEAGTDDGSHEVVS